MDDSPKMMRYYTQEMVDTAMKIWMHTSVSLIDIRRKTIGRGSPLKDYLLPTSMFIYTHGAPATIMLNQEPYQTGVFSLCHAGKGTQLSITAIDTDMEAFMVLYKAEAPPFYKRQLLKLMDTMNPFNQIYGFAPNNPIFFVEKIQTMLNAWNTEDSVERFYAKVLLYQVLHHVYIELRRSNVSYMEPDYVEWVKSYLDKHFREQISIQALSDRLPISRSLLGRLFRKRENSSLQEYVIKKRIDAARTYLEKTNASIPEIAYGCGFTDEFSMIKLFKKYMQVSPGEYRRKCTMECINITIDNNYHYSYNEIRLEKLVKSDRDGEFSMFGKTKGKQMVLAAAMSLMLILSACTSAVPTDRGQNPAHTQVNVETSKSDALTKTVQTPHGEIDIPVDPQRIFVVSHLYGSIIPFEKPIVGTDPGSNPVNKSDTWQQLWAEQIKDMIVIEAAEIEEVMLLQPDLIITNGWYDTLKVEDLNKIAPTILFDDRSDVEEQIQFFGNVFGMEDRAEQLIREYRDQIEHTIQELEQAGVYDKKLLFIENVDGDTPGIHLNRNRGFAYKDLGLKAPDKVEKELFVQINSEDKTKGRYADIAMEVMPQYFGEADILIYTLYKDNSSIEQVEDLQEKLSENTLWTELPAVKAGNVAFNSDFWMSYNYTDRLIAIESLKTSLLQLPIAK